MDSINPIDSISILRLVTSFCLVLGLMGALALLLRYLNNRSFMPVGSKRRLNVIETLPLDHKRKAMILQCDNRQHLIILGHENETVIETGLESSDDKDTQKDTIHEQQDNSAKIFARRPKTAA